MEVKNENTFSYSFSGKEKWRNQNRTQKCSSLKIPRTLGKEKCISKKAETLNIALRVTPALANKALLETPSFGRYSLGRGVRRRRKPGCEVPRPKAAQGKGAVATANSRSPPDSSLGAGRMLASGITRPFDLGRPNTEHAPSGQTLLPTRKILMKSR